MPCFKGIAVSVHADGAPLPEYSVQKQSRVSRVNTYIPVPPPKIPKDSTTNKPEPSKFAISITLLTPGLAVPYSTPKPSQADPYPKPQIVVDLPAPGQTVTAGVGPYIPLTKSENETIAAYIYFDGRAKEEVATLLRPGEETWVNSRWVQVPESEGGGLAEREFLFREVGLERWLNGLDLGLNLDGKDAAAKIQKRREKFERRRRRREEAGSNSSRSGNKEVLRYGADASSPVQQLSDEEDLSSDSDDDAPPEATGQIKVAMFRVLASGEIKRGEYSPQFDAHDDDDETSDSGMKDTSNGSAENVDHTTSFAKPKTLDPSTISTQTVTGIDGPEKPYATFTFFYRGERQLQKMGIMESKTQKQNGAAKRRSTQIDFSNLGSLKTSGTVGFSKFRDTDNATNKPKSRKKSNGSMGNLDVDSDDDDDDHDMAQADDDDKDVKATLSPEDARFSGELADGVGRIKLKRQHSAEPESTAARKSPGSNGSPTDTTAVEAAAASATLNTPGPANIFGKSLPDDTAVGSPMKKHRASIYDNDEDAKQKRLGADFPPGLGDVLASAEASQSQPKSGESSNVPTIKVNSQPEEEEEL